LRWPRWWEGGLVAGLLVSALSGAAIFLLILFERPHGQWDAWAYWLLRARFIFRAPDAWLSGFSPLLAWSHPDYPLLLSSLVVRGWLLLGGETLLVGQAVALLFTAATALLLYSAVSTLRGMLQGLVAALILVSTPLFIAHGASQQADVPLAFYILATVVAIVLYDTTGMSGFMVLAGIAAGLAAWTKNEGLLFILCVLGARCAGLTITRRWLHIGPQAVPFFLGLLPAITVVLLFKVFLAPPDDLVAATSPALLSERLLDLSRWQRTLRAFASPLYRLGDTTGVPRSLVLVGYGLLMGASLRRRDPVAFGAVTSLFVLGLMLAGYVVVYVSLTGPLEYFLTTGVNVRVLTLWPAFLFLYFLFVTPPDGAASRPAAASEAARSGTPL
jgi:hypothetical protein